MALPSAPLGSMPNINAPSYIPHQVYEKRRNPWETALIQILGQAVSGAAMKGVDNVMSRDFAENFGETKAGGLDKLVSGPKVTAQEAGRRETVAAQ